MDYQILQSVDVPQDQQERVTSGWVEIDGREVGLMAQTDTETIYTVNNKRGNIVWMDTYIGFPREALQALADRFGVQLDDCGYCQGYYMEIPTERENFLNALRRLK